MKWLLVLLALAAARSANTSSEPTTMSCKDFAGISAQIRDAIDLCDPAWKDRRAWTVRVPTDAHCSPGGTCAGGGAWGAGEPLADQGDMQKWFDEGDTAFVKEVKAKGATAACVEADASQRSVSRDCWMVKRA